MQAAPERTAKHREKQRERDESGGNEKVTGPTVTGTAVFQIPTLPDSQGMNN